MVKNPREDWCTQQREYFEHLPPLEVTEEQLREQAREFEAVKADIAAHQEPSEKVEEMAQRFLRETEVGARMSGWVWSSAGGPVYALIYYESIIFGVGYSSLYISCYFVITSLHLYCQTCVEGGPCTCCVDTQIFTHLHM